MESPPRPNNQVAGFPVFDILARRAAIGPDRPALHELATGTRLNYRELNQRTACTADLLSQLGIGVGDRVTLLCRNRIEFFELLFACARMGAILVPLNWRMPAAELAPLIEDCGATLLVHGSEDREVAAALQLPRNRCIDLDGDDENAFSSRRDACDGIAGRRGWRSGETWYLLYTSGTTGQPKAVIQTHGMALANYVNISQAMSLRADDTTLNYLPLFHTGGINLTTLPALIMGGEVLITPGFDLDLTIDLLESGRLDTFLGVPAIFQAISLHPRFDEIDFSRVRAWGCGGAPMPVKLLQAFSARGAIVRNGMGMTETGPTVFLMDEANVERKIGSVGKPQLLADVRLVDSNGIDVPPGETAELWFSGLGITPGYFNQPEATEKMFSPDGWLRSGDLGRQDEDGYYYIVGRLKDMYISGGENVYAAEVESRLAQHEAILEAAVVGEPDDKWGEVGHAWLLLRPGHAMPGDEPLKAYCRQHLAAYKVPARFTRVEEFPRTAAGKIQKHLLPDAYP